MAPVETPAVVHPTRTEFIPPSPYSSTDGWHPAQSAVLVTLLGLLSAVLGCIISVQVFERLSTSAAFIATGAMAVVGLIAAARRVPVALWWVAGVVLGGLLGYWS
jgi:hypothetical protein